LTIQELVPRAIAMDDLLTTAASGWRGHGAVSAIVLLDPAVIGPISAGAGIPHRRLSRLVVFVMRLIPESPRWLNDSRSARSRPRDCRRDERSAIERCKTILNMVAKSDCRCAITRRARGGADAVLGLPPALDGRIGAMTAQAFSTTRSSSPLRWS